jgi:erythrin-vacuolar iron transport family protein
MRIDFAKLSLRGAFDMAIMIEEDAELRYREFMKQVADPGAAAFFGEMVVNERKHRHELEARRRVVFRNDAPRIEISVMDEEEMDGSIEAPDASEILPRMSAREAMETALRAEKRAHEFYAGAIPHIVDSDVRAFFQELAQEEVEHQEMLQAKIDALASR